MSKSVWVDAVTALEIDGNMVCITVIADGETLVLRGKRHVAVEGIAFCQRRYREEERAQRFAQIVPLRGEAGGH